LKGLKERLKDRESRQYFYEEHIENGLPVQTRELRKKRKLTQKQLAQLMECDQSNVSDWENPNYEYTPQIGTLKRLANVFDVPLIVRFGSWEELLEWDETLSPEKVAPESFDEFVERLKKENISKPTFTLIKGRGGDAQLTLQYQKDLIYSIPTKAKTEPAKPLEVETITGGTQLAKMAVGGARQ
jgi:transcriptional regulator with XRE-family HTH domain